MLTLTLLILTGLAVIWLVWRLWSRERLLPCPASISWMVEMENPLARVTRSEAILRLLAPTTGHHVADIGCGPGRVTLPLAQAVGSAGRIFAIDIQQAMLDKVMIKAAKAQLHNIRPICGDARQLPIAVASLNGAVVVMALGEIPNAAAIFPALYQVLKSGGRLVITESRFDPHFTHRRVVAAWAVGAGFIEKHYEGNRLAYTIVFEKPSIT